jgi:heat shock protein beta
MKVLALLLCAATVTAYTSVFIKPKLINLVRKGDRSCPSPQARLATATVVEPEQFKFESNVARVMDIIINSLYSNKDVFIRELVSNAADACDKKRFTSLTSGAPAEDLRIRVYADREKNTLTIEDRGIGMNKDELIQNLGRIAESGTKRFMDNIGQKKDEVSLIGQFGVGFYSGFLVANRVEVITKGSQGEQLRWEAAGDKLGEYTIAPDSSEPIATTGTRIVLHLKDECDQYLDDVALRALLEKYSEFIAFPIE